MPGSCLAGRAAAAAAAAAGCGRVRPCPSWGRGSVQQPGRREGRAGGHRYFMAPGDARPASPLDLVPVRGKRHWSPLRPPAGAARPPERLEPVLWLLGWMCVRARSLSLAMTGAVRAIAQSRVSHHSEPARPAAGSLPPGRKPEPAGGGGRSYLEAPVPWAGTG